MKPRLLLALCLGCVAAILIVLGYFSWNASIRRDRAELPRYGSAPEFDLKDQDGTKWNQERLRGKIWVAGFIDMADSGANALLSSRFAELDQNFRSGEQLALISTVLPAADHPEPKLADLTRRYLASSHWHFVAGTPKQIHDLLDRWKQIVSEADGSVTSRFFLVDCEGAIRGVYDGRSSEAVPRVLEDIGTLLRSAAK